MLCFRRIMGLGPWQCRPKNLFEFVQGLGARESSLGDLGLAAGRDVQHPERHFQNPRCLDVFQAAVRHRPATFYQSGMHPYCPAVPRMTGIADFREIPNMGVGLLTCTMLIERTPAGADFCQSQVLTDRNLQSASLPTDGRSTVAGCLRPPSPPEL